MNNKRKVFISHSSYDKEKIDKFASSLKSLGCDIFYSSDVTTNKIQFGTYEGGIYGQIKTKISEADVVLFMVSENFYNSIPSMIEIGISYALEKDMIPISFKSGNYKEDLRALFNYNQLLPSLDNDDDVMKLLTQISNSNDTINLYKYLKEIVKDIKLKNSDLLDVNIYYDEEKNDFTTTKELVITNDNVSNDVLSVVNKMEELSNFDYLFIKYIYEERISWFSFCKVSHWSNDFIAWLDRELLYVDEINQRNEKFIRLLNKYSLLYHDDEIAFIEGLGIDVIDYIYRKDKEKISNIINREYSIF